MIERHLNKNSFVNKKEMQRSNYFPHPDNAIELFLDKDKSLIERESGIWQGTKLMENHTMYILRNVELNLDFSEDIDSETKYRIIKPDLPWAEDHFQERIGGKPTNPGETYKYWPYHTNLDNSEFKTEVFDHTYQERFWPKLAGNTLGVKFDGSDFNGAVKSLVFTDYPKDSTHPSNLGIRFDYGDYRDVVKQLGVNPLTRQAYLPIFFPEDTGAFKNGKDIRVPCTLGYLFEIWDGRLEMTYYIRSCDIFRHYRNDIYLAYRLIEHTSNILYNQYDLHVKPGNLNMKIANLHLFKNDYYPFMKRERNIKNL